MIYTLIGGAKDSINHLSDYLMVSVDFKRHHRIAPIAQLYALMPLMLRAIDKWSDRLAIVESLSG